MLLNCVKINHYCHVVRTLFVAPTGFQCCTSPFRRTRVDTPPPPWTQVPDQQCGERASAPEIPGFQSGVHPTRGWRIGRVLHFRCRKFDCMVLFWFCYSHIFVAATSIFGECELNWWLNVLDRARLEHLDLRCIRRPNTISWDVSSEIQAADL